MKDRPILFSAPMVRAILEGRKTQTRRVVKPVGNDEGFVIIDYGNGGWPYRSDDGDSTTHTVKRGGKLYHDETPHACPYGQPGDRLWVREAWATHACFDNIPPRDLTTRSIHYQADGKVETGKYRQAFHMPRWASRILLEVTGVRVERLQDISEADALAEGVTVTPCHPRHADRMGRNTYRDLWESINGPGSWDANPWVWVIEFKRVT